MCLFTATEYREQGDNSITPFFVSIENDTMCFMLAPGTPPIPALQFQVHYPAALKVDSSILGIVAQLSDGVSSMTIPSRLQSMVHNLRNEISDESAAGLNMYVSVHNSSASWNDENSQRLAIASVSSMMQRLMEYKTDALSNFYFVDPKDTSVLSVEEKDRVALWNKGKAALFEKLSERRLPLSPSTAGVLTPDPCRFKLAIAKFILTKVSFTVGCVLI